MIPDTITHEKGDQKGQKEQLWLFDHQKSLANFALKKHTENAPRRFRLSIDG